MKKTISIKASGKSMFPLISSGDILFVDVSFPFSKLRKGNIILYRNYAGNFLSHRIVFLKEKNSFRNLKVKGDFNRDDDADYVFESDYIGVVVGVQNEEVKLKPAVFNSMLISEFFLIYSYLMKNSLTRWILFNLVHNYFFYELVILWIISVDNVIQVSMSPNNFLVYLLKNKKVNCKWDFKQFPISEKALFLVAESNKAITYLDHILGCKNCLRHFTSEFVQKLKEHFKKSILISWQKEKIGQDVLSISQAIGTKAVSLKEYAGSVKLRKNVTYDIDLLVRRKDFKKLLTALFVFGYRTKNLPPQEVQLLHKKHKIVLDLHHNSSIPRGLIFSKLLTQKISTELIRNSKNGMITLEFLILSAVIRLWTNDFIHGLRKIYEISMILSGDKDLDWVKLESISKEYGFWNEVVLIMYIGKNIFDIKINKDYLDLFGVKKKVQLVAKHFSIDRVSTFRGDDDWWDENSYVTRKFLVELHIVRLAFNLPIYKMFLKPRLLFFIFRCIVI